MTTEDRVLAESAFLDAEKAIKLKPNYDPTQARPAYFDQERASQKRQAQLASKKRQGGPGGKAAAVAESSDSDSEEEELVDVAEGHFDGGLEEFGLQMSDHVMGGLRSDGKPRRIGIQELLDEHGPEGALDKICVQGPRWLDTH